MASAGKTCGSGASVFTGISPVGVQTHVTLCVGPEAQCVGAVARAGGRGAAGPMEAAGCGRTPRALNIAAITSITVGYIAGALGSWLVGAVEAVASTRAVAPSTILWAL